MKRFMKRLAICAAGLSLLVLSWILPAQAWADSGQDRQVDDVTIVVTTPAIPFFPGLDVTTRVPPPICNQVFEGTPACPPGVVVDLTIPGS